MGAGVPLEKMKNHFFSLGEERRVRLVLDKYPDRCETVAVALPKCHLLYPSVPPAITGARKVDSHLSLEAHLEDWVVFLAGCGLQCQHGGRLNTHMTSEQRMLLSMD